MLLLRLSPRALRHAASRHGAAAGSATGTPRSSSSSSSRPASASASTAAALVAATAATAAATAAAGETTTDARLLRSPPSAATATFTASAARAFSSLIARGSSSTLALCESPSKPPASFPAVATTWDEGLDPAPIRRVLTKRPYFYNKIDAATRDHMRENVVMVSGSSHPELSAEVAEFLGIELSSLSTGRFADGESSVRIGDNVRGKEVFVLQSLVGTENGGTLNDAIIELLLTISAARRSSAGRITAVIPYFAYARQSRKGSSKARTTIAAGDLAKMLHSMGVDRVLTVDLHSPEIVGCFPNTVNVTNLVPTPVAAAYFGEKDLQNPCVVSPKSGGIFRAKQFCHSLKTFQPNAELVTFVKDKFSDGSTTRRLLGDVTGKDCILVDDMMDTGTTIIRAAQRLKRAGARKVFVYVSHGIFSGTSWTTIVKSRAIDEVVVANTIPAHLRAGDQDKIRHLSLAPLLAEAMSRMVMDRSTRVLTKQ